MTNFLLKEYDIASSTEKYKSTASMDPNFLSIAINELAITESGGALDFGAVELLNLADPTTNQSAVTKAFMVAQGYALDSVVIKKDGSVTYTGNQAMGSHKFTGLSAGSGAGDSVRYEQVMLLSGVNVMAANMDMNSNKIVNLANGVNPGDAVNYGQLSAVAGGAVSLTQNHILVGNASNISADVAMSGEATIVSSGAVTLSNAAVIAKVLTGYSAAAGSVSAADSILSAIQKIDANDALKIPLTQKGAANGVATLDGGGKIPAAQLPNSVMELQGQWNASTNSPTLADGTGNPGDIYEVTVAGTQNLGSGSQSFIVGDWVVYGASGILYKSPGSNAVDSVNGLKGVVVLTTTNIAEGTNLYYTAGRFNTAFAAKSTTDLAEGTNLYFTNLRAEDAVGGIVANSSKVSLTYVSGTSLTANIVAGSLVNADINASAAIAYSKLALTGSIVNADINASAAIAYSKLALTGSIVNADIGASAAIAYSKLNLSGSIVAGDLGTITDGVTLDQAATGSKLEVKAGGISNSHINASAAIAYSKLALSNSIVNADINASAAIAYSKLALTGSIVNADINASAAIAYSKLNLSGSIVNADVSASAAIAYSKLNLANSLAAADMTTGVFDQSTIVGGNGTAASVKFYETFTNDNGSAITVGQIVYIKSNGHVDLAQQTNTNLGLGALGVVMDASIASGGTGKIIIKRGVVISGLTGLTPGKKEYASTTAGALTESLTATSGNAAYSVGRAMSATQLIFDPQFEFNFA